MTFAKLLFENDQFAEAESLNLTAGDLEIALGSGQR